MILHYTRYSYRLQILRMSYNLIELGNTLYPIRKDRQSHSQILTINDFLDSSLTGTTLSMTPRAYGRQNSYRSKDSPVVSPVSFIYAPHVHWASAINRPNNPQREREDLKDRQFLSPCKS